MGITAPRVIASGRRTPLRCRARGIFLASLAVGVGSALPAAPALAGIQQEYAAFSDCPVSAPSVSLCVISKTTSGEFHIGAKSVPINETITLQGATSTASEALSPAADGNTLPETSLVLPGGLIAADRQVRESGTRRRRRETGLPRCVRRQRVYRRRAVGPRPVRMDPGAGATPHFATKGGLTLSTSAGPQVKCRSSSGAGEFTGAKSATLTLHLKKCVLGGSAQKCQSAKAAAGEIVTNPLAGGLGFIRDVAHEGGMDVQVGLDLEGNPTLFEAECGSTTVSASGSVIAPLSKIDASTNKQKLLYNASEDRQIPQRFEGDAPDTLTSKAGTAASQPATLAGKVKLTGEAALEIKAEAK